MSEPRNLANAMLIIASLYVLIYENLEIWTKVGLFMILLFALGTWGHFHVTENHKRLLKMQVDEIEARIKNFNAHTSFMITQSAHAIKGLKPREYKV